MENMAYMFCKGRWKGGEGMDIVVKCVWVMSPTGISRTTSRMEKRIYIVVYYTFLSQGL